MIELSLNKIKIDETRNEQIIVFREKEGTRFLPVVIGMAEVNAIKLKLSGIKPPRPLTHDLIVQILEQLNTKIEKVTIDRLHQNTFYAKIHVRKPDGSEMLIDARPSDSIALAVRANAPVYVAEEVLGEAGVNEF